MSRSACPLQSHAQLLSFHGIPVLDFCQGQEGLWCLARRNPPTCGVSMPLAVHFNHLKEDHFHLSTADPSTGICPIFLCVNRSINEIHKPRALYSLEVFDWYYWYFLCWLSCLGSPDPTVLSLLLCASTLVPSYPVARCPDFCRSTVLSSPTCQVDLSGWHVQLTCPGWPVPVVLPPMS
jgi:hypothetical protein